MLANDEKPFVSWKNLDPQATMSATESFAVSKLKHIAQKTAKSFGQVPPCSDFRSKLNHHCPRGSGSILLHLTALASLTAVALGSTGSKTAAVGKQMAPPKIAGA